MKKEIKYLEEPLLKEARDIVYRISEFVDSYSKKYENYIPQLNKIFKNPRMDFNKHLKRLCQILGIEFDACLVEKSIKKFGYWTCPYSLYKKVPEDVNKPHFETVKLFGD